ncbi:hypothetical protein MDMS009_2083 [Methylophaga thiooxydans DMS010]|uniref:Uncharacterized protein n=1 Tax=Methylophaga thiooxydans DMS010 TaxID=637616 RepID=C0N776_9GAMM|nr:hypothetical protein MDMS009_2083 [Methylophaga thiooxydans DMS010]
MHVKIENKKNLTTNLISLKDIILNKIKSYIYSMPKPS